MKPKRLIIDGRFESGRQDARQLVRIDGREVWLRQQEYNALVKLASERQTGRIGLVARAEFDIKGQVRTVISRLRRDTGLSVIYDRSSGCYRLDVPPSMISWVDAD